MDAPHLGQQVAVAVVEALQDRRQVVAQAGDLGGQPLQVHSDECEGHILFGHGSDIAPILTFRTRLTQTLDMLTRHDHHCLAASSGRLPIVGLLPSLHICVDVGICGDMDVIGT